MTFISYAQNGEDVILWRALKHIENGFYIDVGACDPEELSVTKAFYERGWHGVNIEPVREYYDLCVHKRPRDKNINVAVTARSGISRFMTVRGTGLSTTVDMFAAEAANRGWDVEAHDVLSLSLADICATLSVGDVHFLKIDVEGAERAVLEGADFEQVRPWIVLVEATEPLSTQRSEHLWEHILLQAGYQRAFFDGVNLYFVAQEHSELITTLAAPPNALDDFKPVRMAQLEEQAVHIAAQLEAASQEREEQHRKLGDEQKEKDALKQLLEDLRLQHSSLETAVADQARAHDSELVRQAEAHRLENARQSEEHRLEIARQAETHQMELVRQARVVTDLRAEIVHQAFSATQKVDFVVRRLAQSRRHILALEERLHAQQHALDSIAGLVGPDTDTNEAPVNVASALKAKLDRQTRKIDDLEAHIQSIVNTHSFVAKHRDDLLMSTSWRVSAPLRKAKTAFRIIRSQPHLVLPLVVQNVRRPSLTAPGNPATAPMFLDPPSVQHQDVPPAHLPARELIRNRPHEAKTDRHDTIVTSIRYGIGLRRLRSQY